jgi:hypothetical protein
MKFKTLITVIGWWVVASVVITWGLLKFFPLKPFEPELPGEVRVNKIYDMSSDVQHMLFFDYYDGKRSCLFVISRTGEPVRDPKGMIKQMLKVPFDQTVQLHCKDL